MSSVKLSSSGGGSVSLSAASTSTDVTIKFPSGNSSAGQALVASNTSGELDWETVPNSAAVPLLRLNVYETTASSGYLGTISTPLKWKTATNSTSYETDTHSAWDATNYWYVVPQAGFYRVEQQFLITRPAFVDTTKRHGLSAAIAHATAANKGAWGGPMHIKNFNLKNDENNFTSYFQSGIFRCAAGDVLKTSFLWDNGTDTNNTTTAVGPKTSSSGNIFTNEALSIEFLRPL